MGQSITTIFEKISIIIICFICGVAVCKAEQKDSTVTMIDTTFIDTVSSISTYPLHNRIQSMHNEDSAKIVKKKNIFSRIIDYFDKANDPHPEKKFDVSFLGGPHYSSDYGFGIGLVASGSYRICRSDSADIPSSTVSLYGDATTGCYFSLGIRGLCVFPQFKHRLDYDLKFESFNTYFWGVGYEMNRCNTLKTPYHYLKFKLDASYGWRIHRRAFIGPAVEAGYVLSKSKQLELLWPGYQGCTWLTAAGIQFTYDSRDYPTNAFKGEFLKIKVLYSPGWINDSQRFWHLQSIGCVYKQVWKGGVLAGRLAGEYMTNSPSWSILPSLGGPESMRGYYDGRYRDKGLVEATVELRQHVWRRNGMVLWGGVAEVFHDPKSLRWHKILPNYGIGYRWEFKHRVNVRLDLGVGRGTAGFIFSIDEAF